MPFQRRPGAPFLLFPCALAVLVTLAASGCAPTGSDAIGAGTAEANNLVEGSINRVPRPQPARAAVALFRVHAEAPSLLGDGHPTADPQAEQSFRATQAALLKSPFVLEQALRTSEVAEIAAISDSKDSIAWLRDRIEIAFPGGGEVMEVRVADTERSDDELETLTNAVCEAYREQVVKADWQERHHMKEVLQARFDRLREELAAKRDDLARRTKELARSEARRELLRIEYGDLLQERRLLARKAADAELEFQLQLIDLDATPQPPTLARRVLRPSLEAAVAVAAERGPAAGNEVDSPAAGGEGGDGNGNGNDDGEPSPPWHRWHPAAKAYDRYQATHKELQEQIEALEAEAASLQEQLLDASSPSVAVAPLREEVRRYERLVDQLGDRLLRWEIELAAPSRVQMIQSAVVQAVAGSGGNRGESGG